MARLGEWLGLRRVPVFFHISHLLNLRVELKCCLADPWHPLYRISGPYLAETTQKGNFMPPKTAKLAQKSLQRPIFDPRNEHIKVHLARYVDVHIKAPPQSPYRLQPIRPIAMAYGLWPIPALQ